MPRLVKGKTMSGILKDSINLKLFRCSVEDPLNVNLQAGTESKL
jgi:hypothetical protein